jgi:hypothetical protein
VDHAGDGDDDAEAYVGTISVVLASKNEITLGPATTTVTASVTNGEATAQRIVVAAYAPPEAQPAPPAPPPTAATPTPATPPAPATVVDPGTWTKVDGSPREIAPGATEQFSVTFDRSKAPVGAHVLKIFAYPADRAPEEYKDQGQVLKVTVPAQPPPPKRKWWIYVLAGVLVLAVAGVAYVLTRPPAMIEVPDVNGRTQAEARNVLESSGFRGDISTATIDAPGTATDVAVGTEPAAGESISADASLTLVLGTGRVEVPDLTGFRDADAEQALAELQLTPAFVGGRPGTVISQNPIGLAPVDATVTLTIDPDQPWEPPCTPWPECILPDLPFLDPPGDVFSRGAGS